MNTYEALYIITPEADDDKIQTIASGVEGLITEDGGAIVRSETWGKRRLAYEVKKHKEGVYVLLRFESEPTFITKLEGHFRLSEEIIRNLVVLFDEKTRRLEVEQEKRSADLLKSRAGERGRPSDRDDDDDDDISRRPSRPRRDAPARPSPSPKAPAAKVPDSAEDRTTEPEAADKPEAVDKPEAADKPEAVDKPEPASEPEPTVQPEPAVET